MTLHSPTFQEKFLLSSILGMLCLEFQELSRAFPLLVITGSRWLEHSVLFLGCSPKLFCCLHSGMSQWCTFRLKVIKVSWRTSDVSRCWVIIIENWNPSVSYLSVPLSYHTSNMKQAFISLTRTTVADSVYSHCFMISHIILTDFPPCITPLISVQPVKYTNTPHYLYTLSKQSISVFFFLLASIHGGQLLHY